VGFRGGDEMGELTVALLMYLGLAILAYQAVRLMFGKKAGALRVLGAIAIIVFVIGVLGWLVVGGGCEIDWRLFKDPTCM
jgi:hypothetical protein